MKYEFFAGSYTTKDAPGIYRFALDTEGETFQQKWACSGAENPSYVLPHPNGRVLYSVEELNPQGRVLAYAISPEGLTRISSISSQGADPCHLALEDGGRYLFAANYSSGSVAVFRLGEDGSIQSCTDVKQHTGHSVDPDRQERSHCHFCAYCNGILFVCDLGEDRIYRYLLDLKTGTLTDTLRHITVPAGYGPRHLLIGDDQAERLYVTTEMGASLLVYARDTAGDYQLQQTISALPEGRNADSFALACPRAVGAAIKSSEDGRSILLSLRGMNAIAAFSLNEAGEASLAGRFDCGGNTPRDFTVFGDYLVVANQDSDRLTLLKMDQEGGSILPTGSEVWMGAPVCVARIL